MRADGEQSPRRDMPRAERIASRKTRWASFALFRPCVPRGALQIFICTLSVFGCADQVVETPPELPPFAVDGGAPPERSDAPMLPWRDRGAPPRDQSVVDRMTPQERGVAGDQSAPQDREPPRDQAPPAARA